VPADGAVEVGVLETVIVTWSTDITNLAGAEGRLDWARGHDEEPRDGTVVRGSLAPAGPVVTFTPERPLDVDTTYTFTLTGAQTAAGPVDEVSVTFRSVLNPLDRRSDYEDDTTLRQLVVYRFAADGTEEGNDVFAGPGDNQTWGDTDDVQQSRTVYTHPEQGHWTRSEHFAGPGIDGAWGTDDDVLDHHQLRRFDDGRNTLLDSFEAGGPDGEPFTGDEPFEFRTARTFDDDGLLVASFQPQGPGLDTQWFTGDDDVSSWWESQFDDDGRRTRLVNFGGPGLDGLWRTDDDDVRSYLDHAYDAAGLLQTESSYIGPGVDGLWFEGDDDELSSVTTYTYDRRGLPISQTRRDPTDRVTAYRELTYDAAGNRLSELHYAAGADGLFETGDDYVEVEFVYTNL
ncbi:MAG: Ig-like domain-containing protein, partial [Myxococcota bacterium]